MHPYFLIAFFGISLISSYVLKLKSYKEAEVSIPQEWIRYLEVANFESRRYAMLNTRKITQDVDWMKEGF